MCDVSGFSASEMKELSRLALCLGEETTFSAEEAAQGIEELRQAGLEIADIMAGAARATPIDPAEMNDG